ncbi:hypothetical protein DEO72_LG8g1982 [Vigna unguiculata]|uniref:Uncharacterized protein n=1 Tax=Vigna unguiculata TaxID=3917 RepID=A0A4D6MQZ0_VIGUN|nr:hypothetical protein DEO72_LG8g1982 [Vigna unguiculata]
MIDANWCRFVVAGKLAEDGGIVVAAMEMQTATCSRENGRHHWCRLDVLVAAAW